MPVPRNQLRVLLPYSQMITSRVTPSSAAAKAMQDRHRHSAISKASSFFMLDSLHIIIFSPVLPVNGNMGNKRRIGSMQPWVLYQLDCAGFIVPSSKPEFV